MLSVEYVATGALYRCDTSEGGSLGALRVAVLKYVCGTGETVPALGWLFSYTGATACVWKTVCLLC